MISSVTYSEQHIRELQTASIGTLIDEFECFEDVRNTFFSLSETELD